MENMCKINFECQNAENCIYQNDPVSTNNDECLYCWNTGECDSTVAKVNTMVHEILKTGYGLDNATRLFLAKYAEHYQEELTVNQKAMIAVILIMLEV